MSDEINRESNAYRNAYYGIIKWMRSEYAKPDSPIHTVQRVSPFEEVLKSREGDDAFYSRYRFGMHFCEHFNQQPPHELPEDFDIEKEQNYLLDSPPSEEEIRFRDSQTEIDVQKWIALQDFWLSHFWETIGECETDEDCDNPDPDYTQGLYEGADWLFKRFI